VRVEIIIVRQEARVNTLANTTMNIAEWGVVLIVVVGALVFTLAWWKIADRWADSEHKRFGRGKNAETIERVVIKKQVSESDQKPGA